MATATKSKTQATQVDTDEVDTDDAPGNFQILTEAPVFRSRRPKSPLRKAMEALDVGQSMTTGYVTSGETPPTAEDKNMLSKVRQRTQQISKDDEFPGFKYSVRVGSAQGQDNLIIVTRNA